jgi:hypothetical protein
MYFLGIGALGIACYMLPTDTLSRISAWIQKVDLPSIILGTAIISIGLVAIYWNVQSWYRNLKVRESRK